MRRRSRYATALATLCLVSGAAGFANAQTEEPQEPPPEQTELTDAELQERIDSGFPPEGLAEDEALVPDAQVPPDAVDTCEAEAAPGLECEVMLALDAEQIEPGIYDKTELREEVSGE